MENRIAVITGATSGIGRAVAEKLLTGGAKVVANARREERLKEFKENADTTGRHLRIVAGDASQSDTISRVLDCAREEYGREADIVVVNAGRGLTGSLVAGDESQWDDLIQTNITGALRLMREASIRMIADVKQEGVGKRPRDIIVIGSCVGRNINPRSGIYSISKFAVNTAAESLRRDICEHAIRVTLIEPGIVKTEFFESAGYDKEFFNVVTKESGPLLEAKHVANAICFSIEQPWFVHLNDISIRPTGQNYP
jgi:NADP-dependent 3-hydroxy acid dehydrogenase YdfG